VAERTAWNRSQYFLIRYQSTPEAASCSIGCNGLHCCVQETTEHSHVIRRARNRQSQRTFRERRMLRIQELESRVQSLAMSDNERNAKLVAENNALRANWIRARQQAANLEMMLQNLKQTLSSGLDLAERSTQEHETEARTPTSVFNNSSVKSLLSISSLADCQPRAYLQLVNSEVRAQTQPERSDRQLQSNRSASETGAEYDTGASHPSAQYSRFDAESAGSPDPSSIQNEVGMFFTTMPSSVCKGRNLLT